MVRMFGRRGWKGVLATAVVVGLALASRSEARGDKITTKSVSYCSDPVALLVDKFFITYFHSNSSIAFDISAASISTGLNISALVYVNAYGKEVLNVAIDFCSVLSGILCPLPTYYFVGSGIYSIPSSITPDLPSSAFTVPDLEAVVTVQLIDTASGLDVACLQVLLGNGHTVALPSIKWGMSAFLLVIFLLAVFSTIGITSQLSEGVIFFLLGDHFQHIAASGLMSLNYPYVFRQWTTNFAWSLGLLVNRHIEAAIDRLRASTGGNGITLAQDNVLYISRKYSPYNINEDYSGSGLASTTSLLVKIQLFLSDFYSSTASHFRQLETIPGIRSVLSGTDANVPFVTRNMVLLDPGLAAYANALQILVFDAYMTVFLWLVILLAFSVAIFATSVATAALFCRFRQHYDGQRARRRIVYWASTTGLRILIFIYPPLSLFTFWQWSLGNKDAWLPIFISVLAWLATTGTLLWVGRETWRIVEEEDKDGLWEPGRRPHTTNVALCLFKRETWWSMGPMLLFMLLKMMFVAFAQGRGMTQVVAFIVLEVLNIICLIVVRPYYQKRWNILAIFLSLAHLLVYFIFVAFDYSESVEPIRRTILGFVCLAVQSIGIVVALIWLLLYPVRFLVWSIPQARYSGARGDVSSVEKGGNMPRITKKSASVSNLVIFGDRLRLSPPERTTSNRSSLTLADQHEQHNAQHEQQEGSKVE